MYTFLQLLGCGVMNGMVYALIALGMVLIYKSSKVLNFAHGQLGALGAFILFSLLVNVGISIWPSLIIVVAILAFVGFLVSNFAIRPMLGQPLLSIIIMTIGLSILFDGVITAGWGTVTLAYPSFPGRGTVHLGPIAFSGSYITGALICLAFFGAFVYLFQRTKTGLLMRSVAESHSVARSLGIKVNDTMTWVWVIACMSVALGGIVLANIVGINPRLSTYGFKIFPVILLGGLESIPGALVGGVIVGAVEMLAAGYLDTLVGGGVTDIAPFVLIILILMIKPYGLFGEVRIERI